MLQFLILMDSIWTVFQLLFLGLLMIFQLLIFGLLAMFQLLSLGPSRVMSSYVVALLFLAAMAFSQEPCENDVQILISANNAHASEGKKFHLKVNDKIFFYYTLDCLYLTRMFLMSKSKVSGEFTLVEFLCLHKYHVMLCFPSPKIHVMQDPLYMY